MQHIERELQYSGCKVEWQEAKLQQHRTSAQNHVMHKCDVLLEHTLDAKREC